MNNPINRLANNLHAFSTRLGSLPGTNAYAKMYFAKLLPGAQSKQISFCIPQSKGKVFIRPKTTDPHAFRQVFIHGDYDFPINFKPKTIVDAGAHVGYASVYFLHRFPTAKIFAIEPEKANAEIYKSNLMNYENVTLFQGALWGSSTTLNIKNPEANTWSFRMQESSPTSKTEGINSITIQDILEQIDFIDILKLDIEGAEYNLFNCETPWLDKVKMLVIELHERYASGCTALINKKMQEYGFDKILEKGENVVYQKTD